MKIKICGLTKKDDLVYAASLGADALGVVNVKTSKRYVSLKESVELFKYSPVFVTKVLVASPKDLEEAKAIEDAGINCLQIHGKQDIRYVKGLRENLSMSLIKQVSVTGPETIELCKEYSDYVDAILLDTEVKGVLGGTGKTHDWNVSLRIVKEVKKPVILAGGLNPENVTDAINRVNPYAVDVASGVETSPGIKDKKKIEEFIKKVKSI